MYIKGALLVFNTCMPLCCEVLLLDNACNDYNHNGVVECTDKTIVYVMTLPFTLLSMIRIVNLMH